MNTQSVHVDTSLLLQKSIRELATSGKEKHSLNEKLCRFWMQNCGKLINEVPSCLAAAGSQVWGTAHVLYAAVSVAPTLCSQPGLSMPLEQRQLLLSTLSQHLLPRVQVCAEQALSHLSQASIHQHLQGLARYETSDHNIDLKCRVPTPLEIDLETPNLTVSIRRYEGNARALSVYYPR